MGSINTTVIDGREILKRAIVSKGNSIMLGDNDQSGDVRLPPEHINVSEGLMLM
ncbi:JAB domain-containing protein, partial [Staphylococcus cohnii]|uniref:JAB domain-containing protein n=1 Tax=Staphylococcus cohnii TaxID=29382 RepID=UPI0034DB5E04